MTSVVTPRGLEVTTPTPGMLAGCLGPMVAVLVFVALLLNAMSDLFLDGTAAWMPIFEQLFGWWWLAFGLVALVLMLVFNRHGNDHVVFGVRSVRRQHRLGRIVVHEDEWPLARVAGVETVALADGAAEVRWRLRRRPGAERIGPLAEPEAEALAGRIHAWLAAPGELRIESSRKAATPAMLAEAALSLVTSRLTLVVPITLAAAALLLLATSWQLAEARRGRAAPPPRFDGVADGVLRSYAWYLHAPESAGDTRVQLRLAVDYTDDDGVTRTLWLRSRSAPELWHWHPAHVRRAGAVLGMPAVEFRAPPWMAPTAGAGDDWSAWAAAARRYERTGDPEHGAAALLAGLDDPFTYLTALWTAAPSSDWTVVFDAASPGRAMPLRWAEAERTALSRLPNPTLAAAAGIAAVLILLTLPRLFTHRSYRHAGRIAALGVVLSVPWWADHAARIAGLAGGTDWLHAGIVDVLRSTLPDSLTPHAHVRPARPPVADAGVVVRWTPQRSAAAPLLVALGLDVPPERLPLPDSAAAAALMVERAAAALARMSDGEVVRFLAEYERADWFSYVGPLHVGVVEPALCVLLTDPARRPGVREQARRLIPGPPDRHRQLCG